MIVRAAIPADASALATIYAPAVLTGTASFEVEPPSVSEMTARLAKVQGAGWPWLVAERDGAVIGYAYASQFRDRAAYTRTCETSVYVSPAGQGQGVGRALLAALVAAAAAAGFDRMIAVIGDSANAASISLHRASGFVEAGLLSGVGIKFGRRLDVVYMQRSL